MTTYKVPFVSFKEQYSSMKNETDVAIEKVLTNGDLILRKDVEDFENSIAAFLNVKYGIGVNSCTDALILSLKAVGIKPGDEVITVAHTFVATIEPIIHCGATPILIDVADDYNMDTDKLEKAITPRTKAIIPVHFNGRLCDMQRLMPIAQKYNLFVIEDAAQALGATVDGRKGGSFGISGCFSFYPAKLLGTAGDGGLVCTSDEEFAEKIRLLRDHGRPSYDKTVHACYGFTSRLHNLQAAILNVRFKRVPQWIERRREIAKLYHSGLSGITSIKLPSAPERDGRFFDVYQNYVLRAQKRDELASYLTDNGIENIVSNPIPVHHQQTLGLSHFQLPNTEQLAKEVISIPLIPELTDQQVNYVIQTISKFYK